MSGIGARGPVHSRQLGMVMLTSKCVGAGTGTPTAQEGDATVARDDTGDYTLTFPALTGGLDIRNVEVFISQAATKDLFTTTTYDEAAGTVTVTVKNGGSSFAEIDLTSSETMHVTVWSKTTKV